LCYRIVIGPVLVGEQQYIAFVLVITSWIDSRYSIAKPRVESFLDVTLFIETTDADTRRRCAHVAMLYSNRINLKHYIKPTVNDEFPHLDRLPPRYFSDILFSI